MCRCDVRWRMPTPSSNRRRSTVFTLTAHTDDLRDRIIGLSRVVLAIASMQQWHLHGARPGVEPRV